MIYVRKFLRPEGIKGKDKYRLEHESGLRLLADALKTWPGFPQIKPEELEGLIARKEGGKPYFPDFPQVHFNISHSQDVAVCAVGSAPLGVDVEKIRPVSQNLARHMLTEGERRLMEAFHEDERNREMLCLWTLKESLGKALGIGLGLNFRRTEFMLKPWKICGDPETMRIRGNTEIEFRFLSEQGDKERRIFPEQWHFFQTVWEDGYVISYCGREAAVSYSKYDGTCENNCRFY